jgi:hypothetical protein
MTEQTAALEEAARATPCPVCGEKSLTLSYQIAAKPIGSFSLSGQQMKFSAFRYAAVTCGTDGCPFRATE